MMRLEHYPVLDDPKCQECGVTKPRYETKWAHTAVCTTSGFGLYGTFCSMGCLATALRNTAEVCERIENEQQAEKRAAAAGGFS